jgi:hypothetical protein
VEGSKTRQRRAAGGNLAKRLGDKSLGGCATVIGLDETSLAVSSVAAWLGTAIRMSASKPAMPIGKEGRVSMMAAPLHAHALPIPLRQGLKGI